MLFRKKDKAQTKATASPELIADVGRYVEKTLEKEQRTGYSIKGPRASVEFHSTDFDADKTPHMFQEQEEKLFSGIKYFISDTEDEEDEADEAADELKEQSSSYSIDLDFLPEVKEKAETYYQTAPPAAAPAPAPESLADRIKNIDEPFMATLFRLIDEKELTDAQVYKKANIDRRLFSKMRKNRAYIPSFRTAVALAISLELDLEQTANLLRKAGYSLSHSKTFDIIIEYFISNGKYNIFEINEVLHHYDQALLGG